MCRAPPASRCGCFWPSIGFGRHGHVSLFSSSRINAALTQGFQPPLCLWGGPSGCTSAPPGETLPMGTQLRLLPRDFPVISPHGQQLLHELRWHKGTLRGWASSLHPAGTNIFTVQKGKVGVCRPAAFGNQSLSVADKPTCFTFREANTWINAQTGEPCPRLSAQGCHGRHLGAGPVAERCRGGWPGPGNRPAARCGSSKRISGICGGALILLRM